MRIPSRRDALYWSPLIFTFIFTLLKPNQSIFSDTLIQFIRLLIITNFPGFYITLTIKHEIELDHDEFLVLNPVINIVLVLFSYIFLTFLPFRINRLIISSFLTVVCAISFVFFNTRTRRIRNNELKFRVGEIIGFCWSFISGAIMILKVLPAEYWYGNDTWEAATIINNLPRLSLNPWEAFDYYYSYLTLSHFGFYYYTTAFHLLTGISTDVILRLGPLIFAGLCSSLVYIIVKRMEGPIIGVFASIVLFINPKMNERFSMLLRENFAFILFLAMLFLLFVHSKLNSKENTILPTIIGLLLAGIVISHPMTAILGVYSVGIYLAHHNLVGNKTRAFELIKSIAITALMILPFLSIVGFTYFILLKNTTQLLQSIFIIITFSLLSIIWFKRILPSLRQKSEPIHRFIVVLITLVVFAQVFLFPRNFRGNPIYDNLSTDMFSGTLNILSVAGLLLSIVLPYDPLIYNLSYFLTFLLAASGLGLRVPLQRLAIYITLIQVCYASGVFNRMKIFTPTIREVLNSLQIPNSIKRKNFNSMIFILIVLLSPILIIETANLTPLCEVTYTRDDIQSLQGFLSTLEQEDLILPHKRVLWALHYLNVSRDIIASTLEQKKWVFDSYDSTDVNDTLTSLPEAWINKKRFHVVSLSSYFYNEEFRDTLPFEDILDKSVEKNVLNTTIVYTFNIPYRVKDIPVRNINTIRDPEKVTFSDPEGSWEEYVKNPSNIISFELDGDLVSLIAYIGWNSNSLSECVCLSIINLNCSMERIGPITSGGYDNPYLVKDCETLYLFCERTVDNIIVRFSSIDGYNWVNETVILPKSPELKYQIMESPIVWKEDAWRMVYTETSSGEMSNVQELVYIESPDGEVWQRNEDYFNWDFFFDDLVENPVEKVLLEDVMRLPDGYLFLGKYYMKKRWYTQEIGTGSFYISTLDSRSAEITPYIYIGLPFEGRRIDSVHFRYDKFNNFRGFFYIDNDEYELEGTKNSIFMGIPS